MLVANALELLNEHLPEPIELAACRTGHSEHPKTNSDVGLHVRNMLGGDIPEQAEELGCAARAQLLDALGIGSLCFRKLLEESKNKLAGVCAFVRALLDGVQLGLQRHGCVKPSRPGMQAHRP